MERVLAAAIFSMAISILAGPKFIAFLRREEYGQHIREEGPAGHHLKQGTPTMGGLLIVLYLDVFGVHPDPSRDRKGTADD